MTEILALPERIDAFSRLGILLSAVYNIENFQNIEPSFKPAIDSFRIEMETASRQNQWFTHENLRFCISAWAEAMTNEKLNKWIKPYREELIAQGQAHHVAVIMAGNIPLVGFHDFICTLMSGNYFIGKLSRDDNRLLPALSFLLGCIEPRFKKFITFTEGKIIGFNAVIATGSNNTSRYFDYYFAHYPHIIRRNRNGIAIITGDENKEEIEALGRDICLYFGLGCRSISKVFLPAGYDPARLFETTKAFRKWLFDHFKYMNNYTYNRTIFQMNLQPFLDNGVLLLVQSEAYSSPISVINYEFYSDMASLTNTLIADHNKIQCIAAKVDFGTPKVAPGTTQLPELWDYADGEDTMKFLLSL